MAKRHGKFSKDSTFEHLKRLLIIIKYIRLNSCQISDLIKLTNRSERTIKRDLDVLRRDFGAPLIFDRAEKSFRFTRDWQILESFGV